EDLVDLVGLLALVDQLLRAAGERGEERLGQLVLDEGLGVDHAGAGHALGGNGERRAHTRLLDRGGEGGRSEEHTSELQSRFDLVCRLLLEKKKSDKV